MSYVFCGWVLLIKLVQLSWHLLGWVGLVLLLWLCLNFFFILILFIYILVIGNIMNKYLFMQVEIAKNLLLFGETIAILFI